MTILKCSSGDATLLLEPSLPPSHCQGQVFKPGVSGLASFPGPSLLPCLHAWASATRTIPPARPALPFLCTYCPICLACPFSFVYLCSAQLFYLSTYLFYSVYNLLPTSEDPVPVLPLTGSLPCSGTSCLHFHHSASHWTMVPVCLHCQICCILSNSHSA